MERKRVFKYIVLFTIFGSLLAIAIRVLITGYLTIEDTTSFSPAPHYGPVNREFKLYMNDKVLFDGTTAVVALSTMQQNVCHDMTQYATNRGDPDEARSFILKDVLNEDEPMPVGMKLTLYWGKNCHEGKPKGIVNVTPNVNKVKVNRVNKDRDPYYKVYNNFQDTDDGDTRILNGHTRGLRWSVPE